MKNQEESSGGKDMFGLDLVLLRSHLASRKNG